MPAQQRGQRVTRPLPYRLAVRCLPGTGAITLAFENQGTAGAVFYVFGAAGAPKRYSLAAHSILSDAIPISESGGYDLQVFGPNGFLRHFTGNGAVHGIAVRHAPLQRDVMIEVSNQQDGPGTVSIVDNAYGAAKLTMPLPLSLTWHATASHGWYDITITTAAATQRAAGHVETGAASMTDPAFG
jgi:phospholipase C